MTQGKPQSYKGFGESVDAKTVCDRSIERFLGNNKLRDKAQCKIDVIKVLRSVTLDPIKNTMVLKYYCEKNTSRIEMK